MGGQSEQQAYAERAPQTADRSFQLQSCGIIAPGTSIHGAGGLMHTRADRVCATAYCGGADDVHHCGVDATADAGGGAAAPRGSPRSPASIPPLSLSPSLPFLPPRL